MNYIKYILFVVCATLGFSQTTPIRNPQIQGTSGSIISGATLANNGTFNGNGSFNFSSGTVTLPSTVSGLASWVGVNSITTLGTITTGTWNATPIGVAYGGSGQASLAASIQAYLDAISTTQGTIIYNNGTDWVALAPGTSGHFLKTQGAAANPVWAAASGGGGSAAWGSITGTLSAQTDLATALATKVPEASILVYATDGTVVEYATIALAKAAATSGQTIYVGPGTYAVTDSILKDGVNWYFGEGAEVTMTSTNGVGILDDTNISISCEVRGHGRFTQNFQTLGGYQGVVRSRHASSVLQISARSISAVKSVSQPGISVIAIYGEHGKIYANIEEKLSAEDTAIEDGAYCVYWKSGNMFVRCPEITSNYTTISTGYDASATGDFFVTADLIETTASTINGYAISHSGNATGPVWIESKIIKASNDAFAVAMVSDNGKLYVTSQKLFGRIYSSGSFTGLLYINTDKIEANANGTTLAGLLRWEAGTLRMTSRHYEPLSYTGDMFKITGGTVLMRGGDFTGGASAKGIEVTGGTAEFESMLVNTSANSSTNGATVSGGTVVFRDVRWTSHASGKDVAQSGGTVTVNGGYGTGTGGNLTTSGTVGIASVVSSGLTIGTTTITSGTSGRVLYNNAGVVGDLPLGTGVATTLATNLSITGGGTISLGGFTFTVPATGTAALLGTANTFTALQTITPSTPGAAIAINSGTVTTSLPYTTTAQTWNAAGTTFRAIENVITDTASASGSTAERWLGGASGTTLLAQIDKSGMITTTSIRVGGTSGAYWSTAGGVDRLTSFTPAGATTCSIDNTNGYFYLRDSMKIAMTLNPQSTAGTTFLSRDSDAAWQVGEDLNGDAIDQVFKAADGITGADRNGADLTIRSGNSTGTGTSAVIISTPAAGSTGTTARTAAERIRISSAGLTIGSGTAVSKLKHGTATLVAGTVTVSDSDVVAGSRIFVNRQTDGGTLGDSYSVAITAATNFVIQSKTANANVAGDTSTVSWIMVNP